MIKKVTTLFFLLSAVVFCSAQSSEILLLKTNGKVVIGDTSIISTPGTYNLYVQNGILTERVKVSLKDSQDWSDDAFEKTPTLKEVEDHIQNKSHLINMPSADEVVTKGYELQDMDAKLLEQIEWLWQHMIELEKENKVLKEQLKALQQNEEK